MCVDEYPQLMGVKRSGGRSPWRRVKEPLKPRLSRKVISSARVNLNKYWSKFEDMRSPFDSFFVRNHDNEVNENLVNDLKESFM